LIVKATILLFAMARETAGASTLTVDLPPNPTVRDLKAALCLVCPAFSKILPALRIAIDLEYTFDDDQPIPTGAELAAIPPVSGGSSSEVGTQT
jgi:molybdopterin converting factor small subunit